MKTRKMPKKMESKIHHQILNQAFICKMQNLKLLGIKKRKNKNKFKRRLSLELPVKNRFNMYRNQNLRKLIKHSKKKRNLQTFTKTSRDKGIVKEKLLHNQSPPNNKKAKA